MTKASKFFPLCFVVSLLISFSSSFASLKQFIDCESPVSCVLETSIFSDTILSTFGSKFSNCFKTFEESGLEMDRQDSAFNIQHDTINGVSDAQDYESFLQKSEILNDRKIKRAKLIEPVENLLFDIMSLLSVSKAINSNINCHKSLIDMCSTGLYLSKFGRIPSARTECFQDLTFIKDLFFSGLKECAFHDYRTVNYSQEAYLYHFLKKFTSVPKRECTHFRQGKDICHDCDNFNIFETKLTEVKKSDAFSYKIFKSLYKKIFPIGLLRHWDDIAENSTLILNPFGQTDFTVEERENVEGLKVFKIINFDRAIDYIEHDFFALRLDVDFVKKFDNDGKIDYFCNNAFEVIKNSLQIDSRKIFLYFPWCVSPEAAEKLIDLCKRENIDCDSSIHKIHPRWL